MKLTTVILITAILHVSATSLAQKVTLNEKNAPLIDVFNDITAQTNYDFAFTTEALKGASFVTINVKNEELAQVLSKILQGQNLQFFIENKTVTIKPTETSLIDNLKNQIKAELALVTITGKVVDELGNPLPGVTVKIKSTGGATATDKNGAFNITVPNDQETLVFSYIGFETQEIPVKKMINGIVITMKASLTNLSEVTVSKGYYSEKKDQSAGDVTVVDAKTLGEQPVSDPIVALEGRVPGLQVTQTSGIPGSSETILLRGRNGIASGGLPLFIVDGVPIFSYSLTNSNAGSGALGSPSNKPGAPSFVQTGGLSPFDVLNRDDIESIEIMKDADATAIYGSRGANGVILITTKKGTIGQTRIDADLNTGWGDVTRTLPLMNTQQYIAMRQEAFKNDGILPSSSNHDVNGDWDMSRYTDWQKVLIGNTSHFSNANVSLSGGDQQTQYLIGLNYGNQTTVFPGDFYNKKISGHFSLNHSSVDKKFQSTFSVLYGQNNNSVPTIDITSNILLAPDAPAIYDASGKLNWQNNTWSNPFAAILYAPTLAATTNLNAGTNLSYEFLPGLTLKSNFGYTKGEMHQSNQSFAELYAPPSVSTNLNNIIANTNTDTWIVEPQLNYHKTLGKGKLDILFGGRWQRQEYTTLATLYYGFLSDALVPFPNNASNVYSGYSDTPTDYRSTSIYGRLNYNWDGKYIINATSSRDGSSRFGPSAQYGNFGSVGAAWIFSNEVFIKKALPFLSFGKLRASYGSTGNDQIADYQYLSSYNTSGSYQGVTGLTPSRIANPYFQWEVVNKLEGGLELRFLDDRLSFEGDVYRNRTGNQLVGQSLPAQDGFTTIQANLPAVVQNSGLEISINSINIKSKNFNWTSAFNITSYRNKLVSYPGLATSSFQNTYVIGQPLYITKMYHYTGVNPQTGVYTFQDIDGNGSLGNPDKIPVSIQQNYFGGLSNTLNYKNWSLDIFFQFVKQNGKSYLTSSLPGNGNSGSNEPVDVLSGHWQNPGDQAALEKFSTGGGTGSSASSAYSNLKNSDYLIVDASYIRLKNIALAYSLPSKWARSMGIQHFSLYAQAQNLLTITDYKGLDPETQGSSLPPIRMISLGIKASF